MIHKVQAYSATCDNCQVDFTSHEDHNIFLLDSDIKDKMLDQLWFNGTGGDPEHAGKHYCSSCWEPSESNPEKIIVDPDRTVVDGVMYKIWDKEDKEYLKDQGESGDLILYNSVGKCKEMLRDEGYTTIYIETGVEFHPHTFKN